MKSKRHFRWATAEDYVSLGRVLYDAVRNGPSNYTQQQRKVWAPAPREGKDWQARLDEQRIIVAEDEKQIIGFMSLVSEGYIDFAYIRPEVQRTGLFRQLYSKIENVAKEHGVSKLWTHASLMAQPAFGAMGFVILEKETVWLEEQPLDRFVMEKKLK